MTGNFPSLAGRNTSARRTRPSSMVIGTSQSIIMLSRYSCRSLSEAIDVSPTHPRLVVVTGYKGGQGRHKADMTSLRGAFLSSFEIRHPLQHGADRGRILGAVSGAQGAVV